MSDLLRFPVGTTVNGKPVGGQFISPSLKRFAKGTIIAGKAMGGRSVINNLTQQEVKQIRTQSILSVRDKLKRQLTPKFEKIKRQLIAEFTQHPITQEIAGGPFAANTSNTLNNEANLFEFIGFEDTSDPLGPIYQLLDDITFKFIRVQNGLGIFEVKLPTPSHIFNVTPMPWAMGRSWAEGIEKGISGLGYLIHRVSDRSRSGTAFQSKYKARTGKFKNTSYITTLLKKYEKRFNSLT